MAYEYEDVIENALIESFVHVEGAAFDELDEVYRKANAFDKIKNIIAIGDNVAMDTDSILIEVKKTH